MTNLKGKAVKTAILTIKRDFPKAKIEFAVAAYETENYTSSKYGIEYNRVRYIDNWNNSLFCIHC